MNFNFLGIGITNLGKRNIQYFFSNCSFCGKFSKIESYDVTSYFSIIFPLYPLKDRKTIKCHRCYKKNSQSLKEFNANHKEALSPILKEYLADPHSDPKAENLLVGFINHYDKNGFLDTVAKMKKIFCREPAIIEAIGDTYLFFTCLQDAEKSYLSSLAINDNPVVREKLGLTLILQSRPHEAWSYLDHIVTQHKEKGLWLLSLLVGAYQANGMHEEAINILDHWQESFPEYTLYQKYLLISQKNSGKKKKVKSRLLSIFKKVAPRKGISSKTAHLFGLPSYPLILILLVVIIKVCFATVTEAKVFLVNGLNYDCRFKLNNNTYHIPKLSYQELTLTHGKYKIEESCDSYNFPTQKLIVKNCWDGWNRPVIVINPDRLAVLVEGKRRYFYINKEEDLALKLYYGKNLYMFDKDEEFFKDFKNPEGISLILSCTSKGIMETKLSLWDTAKPAETIKLLEKHLNKTSLTFFLERYLSYHQTEIPSGIYRSYLANLNQKK